MVGADEVGSLGIKRVAIVLLAARTTLRRDAGRSTEREDKAEDQEELRHDEVYSIAPIAKTQQPSSAQPAKVPPML